MQRPHRQFPSPQTWLPLSRWWGRANYKKPSYESLQKLKTFHDVPVSLFTLHKWQGRMTVTEFWIYTIVVSACQNLLSMIAMLLDSMIGKRGDTPIVATVLILTIGIAATWALFCIQIRRFHDHNMSGWWVLTNLIPFFGVIYTFVKLGLQEGNRGPNKYGNDPRVVADRHKEKLAARTENGTT